ncbi:MAG TPA: ATP-binding protein [Patescibacteria group bacterium]|nr:ATP-binding protein [Patescibacteria group bacterium]
MTPHPRSETVKIAKLRRAAEELLKTSRQDVAALPVGDVQELIHELQVYQIELEMQNEALRQAQDELEQSNKRYRELYDHAPMGYLSIDRNGVVLEANIMAGFLLGEERERLIGRRFAEYLAPETWDDFDKHKAAVFRSGARQICQLRTANDDATALQVSSQTDRDARVCRITLADVTLMKRLEQRLTAAHNVALSANRAKTQFLATMSHEIRTPLNSVVGISDLLSRSALDEKQAQFVATLKSSAGALLSLVNEILDFSRVESGTLELEYRPLDLRAVVTEAVGIACVAPDHSRSAIEIEYDPSLPEIFLGDAYRLRQILLNLVSNAVKFAAGGAIVVRATGAPIGGKRYNLELSVIDTGIGISQAKRERIFEAFTQGDPSTARKFGGAGLGLAICRRLVEAMGGEIGVTSELGEGSVFFVNIPLDSCASRPELRPVNVNQCLLNDGGERHRLLLVEDNPANILVATAYFDEFGFDYDVCQSGREAILQLERKEYSLVLLDVQMPEMDGYETAQRIRAAEERRKARRVPIIAMTAHVLPEDRERCADAGMDAHVSKPFDPAELQLKLAEQLDRERQP